MRNAVWWKRLGTTLCLGAGLTLGMTGCKQSVDLAAVRKMAEQTAQSRSAFDAISVDFYDSCVRAKGYEYASDPATIQDVATLCAESHKASDLWQAANEALVSYIASLGSLATDKTTDFGFSKLTSTMSEAPHAHITTEQQSALASAADGLAGAVFAARRGHALTSVMEQAQNPDPQADCPHGCLADLIESLKRIARESYATQLSAEDTAVYAFYQPNISAGLRAKGLVALQAFGYEIDEAKARQAVADRRASISTYVNALDQIEKTHGELTHAIAVGHFDDALGAVNAFVATYSAKIAALEKAFAK